MDTDKTRDAAITALDRWHAGCNSPVLLVAALEAVIWELRLSAAPRREPGATPYDGMLRELLGEDRWQEYAADLRRHDVSRLIYRAHSTGQDVGELLTALVTMRPFEDDPRSPARTPADRPGRTHPLAAAERPAARRTGQPLARPRDPVPWPQRASPLKTRQGPPGRGGPYFQTVLFRGLLQPGHEVWSRLTGASS
jgi:hypothetical protein